MSTDLFTGPQRAPAKFTELERTEFERTASKRAAPSSSAALDQRSAYRALLTAMADVFAAEGRPGADAAADVLARAAVHAAPPTRAPAHRMDALIREAGSEATHPAARAAYAAHETLSWVGADVLDDHIPTSVSDIFAVVFLVGPEHPIRSDAVRAGLYFQRRRSYYQLHDHSAEETYATLAGEAAWTVGDAAPMRLGVGGLSHHASRVRHATRTFDTHLLAAWRWSGDVRPETYRLLDDSAAQEPP